MKELTLITQKSNRNKPTHKTQNKGSGRQDGERGGRTQTQHLRAGTSGEMWEGEGLEGGGRGIKHMDTARTSRKEVGISKTVDLGLISGGRKDNGFGWGKISEGGEQLF